MTLELSTDRPLIRTTGRSRRHLVIRWTAPPVAVSEPRPPVRVAFSIDRSGSMGGARIPLAREAVLQAIELLGERDAFSISAFDDVVELVTPLLPATAEARAAARRALASVEARGSTNLFRGFLSACETIAANHEGTARCMLLTDGHANVEETDPTQLSRHAQALRDRGIGLSTFGIGEGFDEVLLRGMADAGGGNFFFIAAPGDIPAVMRRELSEVMLLSQKGVTIGLTLPAGATARLIGAQRVLDPNHLGILLGDLVADEQVELVVSLQFPAGTAGETASVGVEMMDATGTRVTSTLSWIFAGGEANDTQVRNRVADRLVAQRHADRARLKALQLNRDGQYAESARVLAAVEARIREYAGDDAVLRALLLELDADRRAYSARMDEMSHKSRHMSTSSRSRGKLESGSARRREPGE